MRFLADLGRNLVDQRVVWLDDVPEVLIEIFDTAREVRQTLTSLPCHSLDESLSAGEYGRPSGFEEFQPYD